MEPSASKNTISLEKSQFSLHKISERSGNQTESAITPLVGSKRKRDQEDSIELAVNKNPELKTIASRYLRIAEEEEEFTTTFAKKMVFPLMCEKGKIYAINPSTHLLLQGIPKIPANVFFPFDRSMTVYEQNCCDRLILLLQKGISGVCQFGDKSKTITIDPSSCIYPGSSSMQDVELGIFCYHLVIYLAFGIKYQATLLYSIQQWFNSLPFVHVIPFCESKLQWGDIVLLGHDKKITHCTFHLGENKFINKTGGNGIYIQNLNTISKQYQAIPVSIIRLKKEYYGKELEFVWEEKTSS